MKRRNFLQSLLLTPLFRPKLELPEDSPGEPSLEITRDDNDDFTIRRDGAFGYIATARHGSVSSCAGPSAWTWSKLMFEEDEEGE